MVSEVNLERKFAAPKAVGSLQWQTSGTAAAKLDPNILKGTQSEVNEAD